MGPLSLGGAGGLECLDPEEAGRIRHIHLAQKLGVCPLTRLPCLIPPAVTTTRPALYCLFYTEDGTDYRMWWSAGETSCQRRLGSNEVLAEERKEAVSLGGK